MLKLFRSKIIIAFTLILCVILMGTLGYRYISEYSWIDAIYMTVITISTVGFMEVRPLGAEAKIFTVILIACSVFILGYALSVISEYLLSKNTLQLLKKNKVKTKIQQLEGHVIICGFGRNGMQAADRLKAYKRDFIVIEKDEEIINKHEDDILFIEGDATEDNILHKAGVDKASFLIVALPEDADNLFVVLSVRQLNPNIFIISRASQPGTQKKLFLAGANKVIMPDKIGGDHMASLVVLPDLITFMDKLSVEGENTTNLEEVAIEDFAGQIDAHTLRDLDLRRKTGCTIIGYIDPNGDYIINPEADLPLQPQGKVIVLGRPEQINKLNNMFHIN
ncbi:MAG: potassium channel protein [Bacteroidia bacterium]|nr:potassium channel protein [Bacteroidia bacterium]